MQNTLMGNVLADRDSSCGLPRVPTDAYPNYSTTLVGTFNASGVAEFSLPAAQRDYLFINMSADTSDVDDLTGARIHVEYCNTKTLVNSAVYVWQKCCDRKPYFLQGVRETKTLDFRITGGTPDGTVTITLSGVQGRGCCE